MDGPGDIRGPRESGALTPDAICGDLLDMVHSPPDRAPQDITAYKNAGGAHLDLLVASVLS